MGEREQKKKKKEPSSPCAACQYFRRRCEDNCIWAPHFPAEKMDDFIAVHRAFGASNVLRILSGLTSPERHYAAVSLPIEARMYLDDPVNGCFGCIRELQRTNNEVTEEIAALQARISQLTKAVPADADFLEGPQQTPPFQDIVYQSRPQQAVDVPHQRIEAQQVGVVFQDVAYTPSFQIQDQTFGLQRDDGARYSGAESAGWTWRTAVFPVGAQQPPY